MQISFSLEKQKMLQKVTAMHSFIQQEASLGYDFHAAQ